jgi:hypothetical protein
LHVVVDRLATLKADHKLITGKVIEFPRASLELAAA